LRWLLGYRRFFGRIDYMKYLKPILFTLAILVIISIILIGLIGYYFISRSTSSASSVLSSYTPCDNDGDGDCDKIDYWLIKRSIGNCIGDPPSWLGLNGYNQPADEDGDGCVTEKDLQTLFPTVP